MILCLRLLLTEEGTSCIQPVELQLQWESSRCGSHVARVWQGNVWNQIARVARDHDDKHTKTRSLVTSSVETCNKQLRDDISQLLGSHEEKHREIGMLLPHLIELLESKLRDETKGALKTFLDMHGRRSPSTSRQATTSGRWWPTSLASTATRRSGACSVLHRAGTALRA